MRLVLLVAGTTLPLIIFAAGIVFNNYVQDRKDATQRVLETVRGIRLVLDAEMQRMIGGLQVLSLTNALRDRDFDGFRRIVTGFLEQYGRDGVVLVADREGRQLFSSVTPVFSCATTSTLYRTRRTRSASGHRRRSMRSCFANPREPLRPRRSKARR